MSITGSTNHDFETLDCKIARGLSKILNGDFEKRVLIEEDISQEKSRQSLTGRQIAWMIYDHFKLTDTDGAFLEFTDLLRVELKGDNLRAFDTLWDEKWFVRCTSTAEQRRRLIARHLETWNDEKTQRWGPGEVGAAARADANDVLNMDLIAVSEQFADVTIESL